MSDVMMFGIAQMPYEMAMDDEISRRQFYANTQRLVAALEAAREDGCVALVADIRFACGDNGKRMQPELVEFIRELAQDAERADYWRQRAKSAEGHLFASDLRAAAVAVHESSVCAGTSWDELKDSQRWTIESVAARVISAVNGERDKRKPKAAIDQARGKETTK